MARRTLPIRDESRERLTDFINGADDRTRRWLFDQLMARHGLEALSDEALQELAHDHARSFWFGRKSRRQNREFFAKKGAA